MQIKTTLNQYSRANCILDLNPELTKFRARSYDRWVFVATDSVGNVFFNDSSYSNTTSGQQSCTRGVLSTLNVVPNLIIHNTLEHFGKGIDIVLKASIDAHRSSIKTLIKSIRVKGSWKRTNEERRSQIKSHWYAIKDTRSILHNYLDKKLIPLKKQKHKTLTDLYKRDLMVTRYDKYEERIITRRDSTGFADLRDIKRLNSFKKYFKTQGRLNKNKFESFLNSRVNVRTNAPLSLDKIRTLLGLKGNDCLLTLLRYGHTNDIENMIPNIDSPEYRQLLSKIKSFDITRDNYNTFSLEKIHSYLTNKINRKSYTPKEPTMLPVSKELLALEGTKHLSLIKTDTDLKKEGRQQGHCIGAKSYVDLCLSGHQALRFKGYTFFLSETNTIEQTHGKHNSITPTDVQRELEQLIRSAV